MSLNVFYKKRFLSLLLILLPFWVVAQKIEISGVVTDLSGELLIGVTILEKDAGSGTSTDIDGKYFLTVEEECNSGYFIHRHETQRSHHNYSRRV